ncbi:MAG: cation:proton antiporter [Planctomycetes bacterium]|nr:cation:proton antiporter [Planctomycetota bacterium]
MPDSAGALRDVLILLGAALILGAVFERLGQSSILGYLLAGTIAGSLVEAPEVVHGLAELGVTMLLFTIGLEFSHQDLRSTGRVALLGGALQIIVTVLAVVGICLLLGVEQRAAIAMGCMLAMSSTACVLRMLSARAEADSVHGRYAVGILLLQDLALVPTMLLVSNLAGGASFGEVIWSVASGLLFTVVLVLVFIALARTVMPRVLVALHMTRNRELPILLATVTCVGAALAAQEVKLSAALGAFAAGVILAESPFATQIRADVSVLRTIFVTVFFASVGMLADLPWMAKNAGELLIVLASVVSGKALIAALVIRCLRIDWRRSLATGLCIAQVGEFSFVLAQKALEIQVFGSDTHQMMISTAVLSLLLTPWLVALASRIALKGDSAKSYPASYAAADAPSQSYRLPDGTPPVGRLPATQRPVVLIGFGPAGREVYEALVRAGARSVILELNPRTVEQARKLGIPAEIGDATQDEVLEHLHVARAQAVVVALPDHRTALQVIRKVKSHAPVVPIVARARFQAFAQELRAAGADVVFDEEAEIGRVLGEAAIERLQARAAPAEPIPAPPTTAS